MAKQEAKLVHTQKNVYAFLNVLATFQPFSLARREREGKFALIQ